jgi:hypothetical protein
MMTLERLHAGGDEDVIARCEAMRELRPHLRDEAGFLARVRRQQAGGGIDCAPGGRTVASSPPPETACRKI